MPPNWGQAIEPAGISQSFKARPFGDHNQQWHPAFNHRRRHRAPLPVEWGQPMEPALMPDPQQPAAMLHHDISPWGQLIERPSPQLNGFQGNENFNVHDAFPGAVVPHNGTIWPWAMDHGNFADAADLARRQSSMRRPPKVKPWRRPSRLLRQFALAPRPTDWRPDYPVRPTGLLRRISRLTGKRLQIVHITLNVFPVFHLPSQDLDPHVQQLHPIRSTHSFYTTIQIFTQLVTTFA